MEWMILPLRRYFEFSGRSRRKEYWMFVLFTIIVSAILGVIDNALGLTLGTSAAGQNNGVLGSIFSLATFIPSLSVAVRRLHDTDRTGWWLLMPFGVILVATVIAVTVFGTTGEGLGPIFGAVAIGGLSFIVLLVFFCLDGTEGPNRFGEDPKNPAASYEGVFD